jgi:hypothetical protein
MQPPPEGLEKEYLDLCDRCVELNMPDSVFEWIRAITDDERFEWNQRLHRAIRYISNQVTQ